jgi:FtsP/CotA-like multicopper oxidase with cupredoxin domain
MIMSNRKVKLNRSKLSSITTIFVIFLLSASLVPYIADANAVFVVGSNGLLVPHYFGPYPNYATSNLPVVTTSANGTITGVSAGIRKFIDSLPLLGPGGANNLGEYIPIAVPDTTTYPGCDYYEIALVKFTQKMSTDLPNTTLQGYVQLQTASNINSSLHVVLRYLNGSAILRPNGTQILAVDNPRYLGPLIVSQRDRPVRVKFTNLLPVGSGGNLMLPVDPSVMGAGDGPNQIGTDSMGNPVYEQYTQNRATLHLHGGNTPWISDGTAHQWTSPVGETTSYPKGVSVEYVPDMWFVNGNVVSNTVGQTTPPVAGATNDPGSGSLTFYYTNQESARLLFYHDHAYGITRLNVYAGEAAPYLIRDSVETGLISSGIIPTNEIPLVIQDKTFVPNNTTAYSNMWGNFTSQLAFQDPTWSTTMWGGPGNLWYPHVYMTNQNPYDPTGTNPFGRWDYSAWFWPPYQPVMGPVANPYYNASNPNNPMEPPIIPGTPNPSDVMEAFMDTPVVNGVAYPYLTVQPQAYRFRILNGADDRFWDLQWYVADNTTTTFDGRRNTEVKMVPAAFNTTYPANWPTDGRDGGVPDPTTVGPNFIQIGTESGFLPAPVVIPNQPVDWNRDMRTFDFGNVNQHALLLGTAERADVIVDFSQYAGMTLILYNDAPAAFPSIDPRQDHFTNDTDFTDSGGPPTTIAGYGPNTRTIMQVRVANATPAAPFNLVRLNAAFASNSTSKGVFAADQNPIIVPQAGYSSAYNTTFKDVFGRIFDTSLTFTPLGTNSSLTFPLQSKSLHDEMNGALEPMYGRMSAQMGVEIPRSTPSTQTTILYNYDDPSTELIQISLNGTLIGTLGDGTQIWRITHNGVDTHTIHWHSFDIQLINRVAWDNTIHPPDPNELGWKDTIRINPLTDTYIALRPYNITLPFQTPNSIRPLDPTKPLNAPLNDIAGVQDPTGEPITLVNHLVNFGNEFVWHCHILGHEENDMMRAMSTGSAPIAPSNLTVVSVGNTSMLNWIDHSLTETSFIIERADNPNFSVGYTSFTVPENVTTYTDTTVTSGRLYYYQVKANNLIGDTAVYASPAVGFPTLSLNSTSSNVANNSNVVPSWILINGSTASKPTLTGNNTVLYLVIRSASNSVNYASYNVATRTWSTLTNIPATTPDSPAAFLANNQLFIAIRTPTNTVQYGSVNLNNGVFSGWLTVSSGSSPSAPALTGDSTTMYLVIRTATGTLNYRAYRLSTRTWGNWRISQVPTLSTATTNDAPAACLVNNQLELAIKGTNNQILYGYINLNVELTGSILGPVVTDVFSGWTTLSASTPSAPTLTGNTVDLYLVIQGLDNAIHYSDGKMATHTWGTSVYVPATATGGCGASLITGKLPIVFRDASTNNLWFGIVDLATGSLGG